MSDFSEHIIKNWEWMNKYRSRLGNEAWKKYVDSVMNMLNEMKPDTVFYIEKNVKPENIDLFIKVCCLFIHKQQMSDERRDFCHSFNSDCTEIRCVKLDYSKKIITTVTL